MSSHGREHFPPSNKERGVLVLQDSMLQTLTIEIAFIKTETLYQIEVRMPTPLENNRRDIKEACHENTYLFSNAANSLRKITSNAWYSHSLHCDTRGQALNRLLATPPCGLLSSHTVSELYPPPYRYKPSSHLPVMGQVLAHSEEAATRFRSLWQ